MCSEKEVGGGGKMVNVCPRESEYVKRKQHSQCGGEGYREIKNKRYCRYKVYNLNRNKEVGERMYL